MTHEIALVAQSRHFSEIAHERQAVVVEVPEGELSHAPRGVPQLSVLVKDPLVLILLEEQVGIVHDQP